MGPGPIGPGPIGGDPPGCASAGAASANARPKVNVRCRMTRSTTEDTADAEEESDP